MKYRYLTFKYSHTGFLKNIYFCKEKKRYYALQWSNGYNNPPILYSATKDGEASCEIMKEILEYFIFPEGHEHYKELLI